jgi:hypothetical protein
VRREETVTLSEYEFIWLAIFVCALRLSQKAVN